jgi:hypothetical protein
MTRNASRKPAGTRVLASVAAAVGIAVIVAGCGSSPDPDPIPEGTDAHVQIDPLDPASLGPQQAAQTAMNAILSWQPAFDTSKTDALTRARPWLTVPLTETLDAPQTTAQLRPDREWEAWARSGDTLTATCTPAADTPASPEGMRTVIVDLDCRQRVLHAAGTSTLRPVETWRATVISTPGGWRLSDFRFRT